uniref:Uncharacterized protein n=1 Tax=Anguilla anguilla TaxID=7936 RepID=A0A0E9VB43_ANGAN
MNGFSFWYHLLQEEKAKAMKERG